MKTTITEHKFIALVLCLVTAIMALTACQSKDNIDPSLFPPEMFKDETARQEIMNWMRIMDLEENRPKE